MARVLRDAEITIEDGARFLVQYAEDPTLHHERRVLRGIEAGGTEAVILTPDYDVYIMDMAVPPLASLHALHEGPRGGVKLPENIKRNETYLFADSKGEPDDRQAARLLRRADKLYTEAKAALPLRPQPARRLGGKTSRADATLPIQQGPTSAQGPVFAAPAAQTAPPAAPAATAHARSHPAGHRVVAEMGVSLPFGTVVEDSMVATTAAGPSGSTRGLLHLNGILVELIATVDMPDYRKA